ncbi:MAG: site-2 protease family protein [Anaerolineae bacterium]|nr:site-2 protease family protein [Anaerolineae bacterium]
MVTDHNLAELDALAAQHFNIEEITYGGPKQPYIARYRGTLKVSDSQAAYESIEKALQPLGIVALLRKEDESLNLYLLPELEKKKEPRSYLNLVLFILTLFSVLFTGGMYGYEGDLPQGAWQTILVLVKSGWPFAVTLLAILGAHEFGHYFAGRKHGVQVTLPYFIPLPLSLFGTMGAFINMRSLPKNRRALFDLAIAGPLSGFVVSIIALIIGLNLSTISQLPTSAAPGSGLQMEGNSLLYLLMKYLTFGKLLPQPAGITGIALLIYWVRYFFTGQPFPWGALDVMLHPVAWAGWAGLFVTGINLLPAGQLDGGHIFSTLFGEKTSRTIFPFLVAGLVILGFFSNVWWIWAALLMIFGRHYAQPFDQVSELDAKRKWLGYLALLIFVLTFIPVPITIA